MNKEGLVSERADRDDDGGVSFTEDELKFVTRSRLARVATVSRQGQPHVVPVAYEFDGTAFYFGAGTSGKA
jgi:pyridoxamine 5'-phosphate oxidase family protein